MIVHGSDGRTAHVRYEKDKAPKVTMRYRRGRKPPGKTEREAVRRQKGA
jgi:hypothetical protein